MSLQVRLRLALDLVIVLVFGAALVPALDWQLRASIMPMSVAGLGLVLGIANLIVDIVRWRKVGFAFVNVDRGDIDKVAESREEATAHESKQIKLGIRYFGWIILFCLIVWVAGSMVGSSLFLLAFLKLEGGYSWRFTAISIVAVLIAILAAEELLNLRLPSNLLDL